MTQFTTADVATATPKIRWLVAFASLCVVAAWLAGCVSFKDASRAQEAEVFLGGTQGVMYVGGHYKGGDTWSGMTDQAYVFYQIPADDQAGRNDKWPIIMVHGGGQTGSNYLGTPDGRPGWAWYFFSRGWPVYVIDQPGSGKSGYFPQAYGAQADLPDSARVQRLFTAPELARPLAWPQASLHSQWPGGVGAGIPGHHAFDQFMASRVATMPDSKQALLLTTLAIGQLLQKIGPAVLMTHSMTGPVSWMVSQANPDKIKAIIAIEPTGNSSLRGDAAPGSPCGITDECLEFSPPIQSAADLGLTRTPSPVPGLQSCWLQIGAPIRTLTKLAGIPVLIATGEASYHAQYDHCTSAFLTQAGVANTWVNLSSVGIKGNGHLQMIEMNNLEIAKFYETWLLKDALKRCPDHC